MLHVVVTATKKTKFENNNDYCMRKLMTTTATCYIPWIFSNVE